MIRVGDIVVCEQSSPKMVGKVLAVGALPSASDERIAIVRTLEKDTYAIPCSQLQPLQDAIKVLVASLSHYQRALAALLSEKEK